jgi:hypothetical protein
MPFKKKNWELEFGGIHNTPEQFFYRYKDITLLSENLFQTPKIIKNRILQANVVKKIDDWVHDNKIQVKKRMEWVELIHPLTDLFAIPKEKRKELFSHYKETQIVKLKQSISAIEKAEKNLFNDKVRLNHLVEPLKNQRLVYKVVLESISKRQTGEHQLLYDLMMPLVDRLIETGESKYRVRKVIDNLMLVFNYDGESVGQSIFKYKKKPYFPKRIMGMINEAGNQPFQPLHQALKKHLDSI